MIELQPKIGRRFRYNDWVFYAMSGTIVLQNQQNGHFEMLPIEDFKRRAAMINRMYQKHVYGSDYTVDRRLAQDTAECIQEAKQQGDPFDPNVQRWLQRESRPVSMLISGREGGRAAHAMREARKRTQQRGVQSSRRVPKQNAVLPPLKGIKH